MLKQLQDRKEREEEEKKRQKEARRKEQAKRRSLQGLRNDAEKRTREYEKRVSNNPPSLLWCILQLKTKHASCQMLLKYYNGIFLT